MGAGPRSGIAAVNERVEVAESVVPELQKYEPPMLRELGDVRQLTLGGSTGSGDSGSPADQDFS